jgi:hypothetical protein
MKKQTFCYLRYCSLLAFLIFTFLFSSAQNSGPSMTDTVFFQVNMKYMISDSTFNPATDTVGIIGSMNDWQGSEFLQRVGTSDVYEIRMELLQGVVYLYKFRIHKADTILTEDVDTITRMTRIPDTTLFITNFYNNINPGTVPMKFNCNLYYQIKAGHFVPNTDFVDVAGNFNLEGANDVLFNLGNDSIYTLTLFMDTTLIGGPPLRFKFRFNGSWATAELPGDSSRTYTLTAATNSFTAWYNNIDPSVPSLPFVYDLSIQDTLYLAYTVSGSYRYEDYNLRPEGNSRYRWYVADTIGGPGIPIDSAFSVAYTIDSVYLGKYLVFEVTPLTQDSIIGLPVRVYSTGKIIGVGIEEKRSSLARIYPNPVSDLLFIEPLTSLKRIDLISSTGQTIISNFVHQECRIQLNLKNLTKGIYFLKVEGKNSQINAFKVIVQ